MDVGFTKMEGLGNDFILMDDRNGAVRARVSCPDLARRLCSRHFGIGADGLILILNSRTQDIRFQIFNADGSEAQMCGNGMRCFARHLYETGITDQLTFSVETKAGPVIPRLIPDDQGQVQTVCVDMGKPNLEHQAIPFLVSETPSDSEAGPRYPLDVRGECIIVIPVGVGNPHAVVLVKDAAAVDVKKEGPPIETHPAFPEKTNVEFIDIIRPDEINMRVWERGAGETLACGTGACAAVVATCLAGHTGRRVTVHLAGGDLEIFWDENTGHLFKTGPATQVFQGTITI